MIIFLPLQCQNARVKRSLYPNTSRGISQNFPMRSTMCTILQFFAFVEQDTPKTFISNGRYSSQPHSVQIFSLNYPNAGRIQSHGASDCLTLA